MNTWTVAGALVVALGTIMMIWGQVVANRAESRVVEQKVEQVRAAIAEARASSPAAAPAIDTIQGAFDKWADDLLREKESRRTRLQQAKLRESAGQLDTSHQLRPVFEEALQAIRRGVRAYSERSGVTMEVDLPPLPENLYDARQYKGRVVFSPATGWEVTVIAPRTGAPDALPFLNIDLVDPAQESLAGTDYLALSADLKARTVSFALRGVRFPRPAEPLESRSYATSLDTVRDAITTILEAQLLMLK